MLLPRLRLRMDLLIGISAGANLVAARKIIKKNSQRPVVTLLCDRGERYFSMS